MLGRSELVLVFVEDLRDDCLVCFYPCHQGTPRHKRLLSIPTHTNKISANHTVVDSFCSLYFVNSFRVR